MRRGFTLLEVMVALVVTSLVVWLGYATLASAMDTQARTAVVRDDATARAATRALLHDALRHAVDGLSPDAEGWRLEPAGDGTTRRLAFVTRGIVPPFGASGRWQVVVEPVASGLAMLATSLDAPLPPLAVRLPDAASMQVLARGPGDAAWRDRWDDASRLPTAINVQWRDASGRPVGTPIVARRAPVGGT
ncbi:MAG: prepilin-type N-terminal cleavage/methylation domain-containing protein [Gemmatimonadaceae bacterium]|jgi:prepilin-type N-terminal cleavage/methylation domain-containing protein|nr:prepilin-type N-terminal cleavage/methylation domain-containing protein [Gemmatimonadaceae bacterium]